jgi:tetratricopeptide (TPR) repeat protein
MRTHGLVVALAALLLAGCNTVRPLPTVRESGDRFYSRGQFEQAAADYKEYTDRKPGEPSVQLAYAKTLLALHQPDPAVEHATIAFDQHPTDDDYIETRAQALFDAKKTGELDRFLRGQTSGRGLPADYIRQGRYLAKLGDADGAETSLKVAAKLDGGRTPEPQLALADFYHGIGDRASELQRLRMALYLDPKNLEVPNRIRALGEIPGPSLALPPAELQESPSAQK